MKSRHCEAYLASHSVRICASSEALNQIGRLGRYICQTHMFSACVFLNSGHRLTTKMSSLHRSHRFLNFALVVLPLSTYLKLSRCSNSCPHRPNMEVSRYFWLYDVLPHSQSKQLLSLSFVVF